MAQSSQQSRQIDLKARLDRYKLQTEFYENTVVHTTYESDTAGKQRVGVKKTWKRERELGAGAFGAVWREVEETGEIRATKILPRAVLDNMKVDYLRELEALAESRDHSDYFVKFLGWFEDETFIFLAMEYVGGGDLAQYIKTDRPKAEEEAKEITSQILKGLVILHQKGICHRDLKPQNILIASTSPIRVKIADFGISKRELDTFLRTNCGTQSYRAPEQLGLLPRELNPQSWYTNAVDLWALGVLVHEILTSEIAFLDPDQDVFTESEMELMGETEMAPPTTDMTLLFEYCHGTSEFPAESLRKNRVSEKGISFVKSLLVADPSARISAKGALKAPWLVGSSDDLHGENGLGANAELTSIANQTTLQEAAGKGQIEVVRLLLDSGIDVNARSASAGGRTALQVAAEKGRIEVVKLLLSSGANANAGPPSTSGQTALQAAAEGGYLDMTKLLIDGGADIDYRPADSWTALQIAAGSGRVKTVRLLLDRGADINAEPAPTKGRTALQVAAEKGQTEVVKLLLESGANVNAEPTFTGGRTALQAAAEKGQIEVLKLLLESGANIDAKPVSAGGRTALQIAAEKGRAEAAELLLDSGADINAKLGPGSGRTALQLAMKKGQIEVVKLLLDRGANANTEKASTSDRAALDVVPKRNNGAGINAELPSTPESVSIAELASIVEPSEQASASEPAIHPESAWATESASTSESAGTTDPASNAERKAAKANRTVVRVDRLAVRAGPGMARANPVAARANRTVARANGTIFRSNQIVIRVTADDEDRDVTE